MAVEQGTYPAIINVRMPQEMRDALTAAAAGERAMKDSVWAREVFALVLASGLSLAELVAALRPRAVQDALEAAPVALLPAHNGNGHRLGRAVLLTGQCLHPVHLRTELPTMDVCACGKQFPR